MMRRISKAPDGKLQRGKGEPNDGSPLFLVDYGKSVAQVNGCLYIDGKLAPAGTHSFDVEGDEQIDFTVDSKGKAKGKRVKKHG